MQQPTGLAADVLGTGPPLVLLHSFPLHRGVWREQARMLSATHQLIMPDLRGFGESGSAPEILTMDAAAADVAALLDRLGITGSVALAGLSMGGYVALAFAEAFPDRVSHLILCDTRAAADSPDKGAERLRTAAEVLHNGTVALVRGVPSQQLSPTTLAERPAVVAAVTHMAAAASSAAIAAALRGMAVRPDRTALLSRLTVPTLVLCGADDTLTPPEEMRAMAAAIPRAWFLTVPEAGHLAPLENPPPVTDAVQQFLR